MLLDLLHVTTDVILLKHSRAWPSYVAANEKTKKARLIQVTIVSNVKPSRSRRRRLQSRPIDRRTTATGLLLDQTDQRLLQTFSAPIAGARERRLHVVRGGSKRWKVR